jgi:hypothetical protein
VVVVVVVVPFVGLDGGRIGWFEHGNAQAIFVFPCSTVGRDTKGYSSSRMISSIVICTTVPVVVAGSGK